MVMTDRPFAYAVLNPPEPRLATHQTAPRLTESVDLYVDGIPEFVPSVDGVAIDLRGAGPDAPNYGRVKLTVHEAEHLIRLLNDTMAGLRAARKDQSA